MSNQLSHLLTQWHAKKDQGEWVLGTIYDHQGPCYRKAGAMMLFNSFGQQFGMLSGGCLESDIAKNARKVMQSGQSLLLCYDGSDEDDLSFQLGIGCGGTLYIMLQLINADNHYLELTRVFDALKARQTGIYHQKIPDNGEPDQASFELAAFADKNSQAKLVSRKQKNEISQWLATPVVAEPHILVAGGGFDARPVVEIAYQLGWRVSLWDPRPANARKEYFLKARNIISGGEQALSSFVQANQLDAAVVMTHNINLDAKAMTALLPSSISYLALLGPTHRKLQVLEQAKLAPEQLPFPLAGPAGLDIGAELPESIALAILSECHASLKQKTAKSISGVLAPAPVGNHLRRLA
ncbi:XdhC family protein [Thalassomonas actiniarum]|uniref:XdhC family protein n=1 Tax=Thalassomonas actiniarum TaxID=485447 RepID=A0AAF0C6U9_9GAMM|nr:XdhC/CoxI family protein [Thalassomonas actiniarum]WDE02490.1 XdhC family protein [Thalassomonas actiniarum]